MSRKTATTDPETFAVPGWRLMGGGEGARSLGLGGEGEGLEDVRGLLRLGTYVVAVRDGDGHYAIGTPQEVAEYAAAANAAGAAGGTPEYSVRGGNLSPAFQAEADALLAAARGRPREAPAPCPFCGGREIGIEIGTYPTRKRWMVCGECGARGPGEEDGGLARAAWNRRVKGAMEVTKLRELGGAEGDGVRLQVFEAEGGPEREQIHLYATYPTAGQTDGPPVGRVAILRLPRAVLEEAAGWWHLWLGTARLNKDTRDAARWRALVGCARIREIGCAGYADCAPRTGTRSAGHDDYRHLSLELWTEHNDTTGPDAVQRLEEFADCAARLVDARKNR
jgi:Lar family restriction alleviation protein